MSKTKKPFQKKKTHKRPPTSSDEGSADEPEPVLDDSSDDNWETYKKKKLEEINEQTLSRPQKELKPVNKKIDTFVIVKYENELYPGVIEDFDEEGAFVSAMMKSLTNWKWPVNKDVVFYPWEKVIGGINPPKMLSKRGVFAVPELAKNDEYQL